ncbi:MAG: polysaccharide biosynthesis protein [Frankiales bacterium]|nr:polysaccharide biosynthesis protein [Frankiales bacterium]
MARNTAVLVAGRVANGAMGVVSVGLMTRYLGVSSFGAVVTASLALSVFSSLADAGIPNLGVRDLSTVTTERAPRLLASLLWLRSLTGVAACALTIGVALALDGRAREALLILAPTLVVSGFQAALSLPVEAQLESHRLVVGDIAGRLVSLAMLGIVVGSDGGFALVVVSQLAGIVVNAGYDSFVGLRALRPRGHVTAVDLVALARRSIAIGIVVVVTTIYVRVDGLLLALLRGPREVGIYGVAYRLPELLMSFPAYLLVSALPVMTQLSRDHVALRQSVNRFIKPLVLLVLPVAAGGFVTAPDFVRILAGARFGDATAPTRLLLLAMVPYFVSTICGGALLALGLDSKVARISVWTLALNVLGNLLVAPSAGAVGAAGVLCGTEVFLLVMFGRQLASVVGLPRAGWLVRPLLATAVMTVVVSLVHRFLGDAGAGVRLAVCLVAGAGCYALLLSSLRVWVLPRR